MAVVVRNGYLLLSGVRCSGRGLDVGRVERADANYADYVGGQVAFLAGKGLECSVGEFDFVLVHSDFVVATL